MNAGLHDGAGLVLSEGDAVTSSRHFNYSRSETLTFGTRLRYSEIGDFLLVTGPPAKAGWYRVQGMSILVADSSGEIAPSAGVCCVKRPLVRSLDGVNVNTIRARNGS